MWTANRVEHPYQVHNQVVDDSDSLSGPDATLDKQRILRGLWPAPEAKRSGCTLEQPMTVFVKLPAPFQCAPLTI